MWFTNKFSNGKGKHEKVLKFKGNDKYVYKWEKIFGKEQGGIPKTEAPKELQPEKKVA